MIGDEREVICPYCWEKITLLIDPTAGEQQYTEDCSVCCQPIVVIARPMPGGHMAVDVGRESE